MNKTKNKVAVAGLTALMASSPILGMVAPTLAFAEGTGDITINKIQGNETTHVSGIQLFKADVTEKENNAGKKVVNVEWANDTIKGAVEAAIKAADPAYAGTTAQEAAEWMQTKIGSDPSKIIDANATILDALAKDDAQAWQQIELGKASTLASGLWLFTAQKPMVENTKASGTSAILAVVGGDAVTVTEKASVPTIEKTVSNGKKSDSVGVGEIAPYVISSTVAGNVNSYPDYFYNIKDSLSSKWGEYDQSSVKVYAGTADNKEATDITDAATITADNAGEKPSLDVKFADLHATAKAKGFTLDKNTVITVKYNVKIVDGIEAGKASVNDAKLIYSNDPYHTDKHGEISTEAKVYSFKINLNKIDSATKEGLKGAKFTLQVKENENKDVIGKYVQADGSFGDQAHEFETGDGGLLEIKGLDAGTYTLHETSAPSGYVVGEDVDVTINPSYQEADGSIATVEFNTTANTAILTGDDSRQTKANDDNSGGSVYYQNRKDISMPLTGMSGIGSFVVLGSAVLAISVVAVAANAKRTSREN